MKKFSLIGLLAALAALAVMAVGAPAAFAVTGTEFVAKPTSGIFPAAVSDEGGEQLFTTKAGEIACEKESSSGQATAEKETSTEELVEYSGKCLAGGLAGVKEPIVAHYEFFPNGTVKILKPITLEVEATILTEACTVTVEEGQTLKGISYTNNTNGTLGVTAKVEKEIHSTGSGGVCGEAETEGSYSGSSTAKLVEGGTLEVK